MATNDLTTLAAARDWAGVPVTTNSADPLVSRLVSAVSSMVYGYLGRPALLPRTVTEIRNGHSSSRMFLRHWPVNAVSAVSIDSVVILPAATPGPGAVTPIGYLLEPWDGYPPGRQQALDLFASSFYAGRQNIVITYSAGYLVSSEAQAIPTGGLVTVSAPSGPWAMDAGVKNAATGAALSLVTGTPSTGQYALVADNPGQYQFATADAAVNVLISYGFIPYDLFQVATELVGERLRYKGRIGDVSKNLGGETASFSQKDMNETQRLMLQPFRRVTIF